MTAVPVRLLEDAFAGLGAEVAPFVRGALQRWRSYKPSWNYEDGVVWKGALDLAAAGVERTLADFVYREVSRRIGCDGRIDGYDPGEFNIDNVNPGRVLFALWKDSGEERFRLALDHQLAQLAAHPRTASGNFWHKRIYPNQVWLDGLYMAQPLRCLVARDAGDAATLDDVVGQFGQTHAHLRDPDSGLLVHGWDESRSERWSDSATGRSPNVWGRALGWYLMALVDCIEAIDAPDRSGPLAAQLRGQVDLLLPLRSADGLWYQLAALPGQAGNYEETSASLMIAYALMKAARLEVLEPACGEAGAQALRAVVARFLDRDALGGICGVAGLGNVPYRDGSIDYYLGEAIVPNDPKGVGALLMALSEFLRRG
ncbi:glycoside hydrolase family 88/105 protein [Coralloluteibacterium stylophorae]|uniref:Glycoside hydrolase family 88 protein n=1 Tax=Coralloluteibacterium stylophorae TaxID=1776034 RepID=A0A8J8AX31_9GAMM|nr:glycoside hydrolase family 88 protein [Coralloluteibacterium stylophorae]MBS7458179.1 glycoside hydrolase family 88 protein [Coralloluteibacterium stylophorae]